MRTCRFFAILSLVGAIAYSSMTVAMKIKSANLAGAERPKALAEGNLIPRPNIKPPDIKNLLSRSTSPECGYGQVENMELTSCEWATRTKSGDVTDELADEAVNAKLLRVVKLYEDGREKEALAALEKPLLEGHPKAQLLAAAFFYDGELLEKNRSKAIELIRLSADQNDPHAAYKLGEWLIADCSDTCPDVKEALRLFGAAYKAGLHEATEKIGRIHFLGIGVPQDKAVALPYIKSAAEGGMRTSQRVLGTMFYKGVDIPQSYELSMQWLKKAAEQGDSNAMAKIGVLHLLGLGTEKNTNKGILWTWLGARKGDAAAQYLVASFLIEGVAGIVDSTEGLMWLKVSASNGSADAKETLKKLQVKLQPGEIMLADMAARECEKNMKKCGRPPWKWEGFGGAKIGIDQT